MPPGLGKPIKGPVSFIDGLSALPCSYLFLRPVGIGGVPSRVVCLPGEMEAGSRGGEAAPAWQPTLTVGPGSGGLDVWIPSLHWKFLAQHLEV